MNENKQHNSETSCQNKSREAGKKIHPDALKWVIIGLVCFAAAALIFGAGAFVGGMKARYSYRWAENYHKNFGGPKEGFLGDWQKLPLASSEFIEGHGAFGEIIELKDTGFVIKGRGDVEKVVVTAEDTVVKKGIETVKDGLLVGSRVVVIGSPNKEGQIEAKLIRIFDEKEIENLRKPFPEPPFFNKSR